MTRADVVAKARELVGRLPNGRPMVPFKHQGRHPKTGLDCAGLPVWVGTQLGLLDFDFTAYERYPDGYRLRAIMDEQMVKKVDRDMEPGDVLLLRNIDTKWPMHLAIVTELADGSLGVIHSWVKARGVIEQRLSEKWSFCVAGCYSYPNLEGEAVG